MSKKKSDNTLDAICTFIHKYGKITPEYAQQCQRLHSSIVSGLDHSTISNNSRSWHLHMPYMRLHTTSTPIPTIRFFHFSQTAFAQQLQTHISDIITPKIAKIQTKNTFHESEIRTGLCTQTHDRQIHLEK